MCQHVRWPFKREEPGFGKPEKSWASWKEGKDGRVQDPAHRVWGTGGAGCGDGAAGGRRWPYGSDGCQAHGFQGFAAALASISNSAAIAWGSYHHYCTHRRLAWDTAISLVLFVWLSSAFWAALPLLGWGHYDYEPLGTCCTLDYSRNFTSFLFTMAFFNFLLPLFITLISYRLMEQKLGKTGHPQVNTTLPARTLLLGWGPYALLYLYAAITDVTLISPKLQMVPALIAKMVPTINAVNYALGSDMVHRGIWQCLSSKRSERD
ncbi:RPE-retinal G protein-coupled receptor isoform X1 [Phyllostomus discolor]|uniref:RPE-retinal G protein-coupled receptor isoform X1 n=1 Tax=Phyllostomus discolor TaxID=89673 RepID=A0A7E6DTT2_9CHIR|nr:RPE-retinal G protein-coupled receptor isoform X1 [Phyllostomus discolor]